MKNRFNVEIKKGFKVTAHTVRGGTIAGIVASIETSGDFVRAYGKRVTLECGLTCAVDDVISAVDIKEL